MSARLGRLVLLENRMAKAMDNKDYNVNLEG